MSSRETFKRAGGGRGVAEGVVGAGIVKMISECHRWKSELNQRVFHALGLVACEGMRVKVENRAAGRRGAHRGILRHLVVFSAILACGAEGGNGFRRVTESLAADSNGWVG